MGRMFMTMVGSIAELERSLIVERIRAGMRRAKLEGQRLGRAPLKIDHDALVRDRLAGMSLTNASRNMVYPERASSALSERRSGVRPLRREQPDSQETEKRLKRESSRGHRCPVHRGPPAPVPPRSL